MQTIVIVGGGAGGLELATRLGDTVGASARARVILVDRWPGHFWKPLLHTVAAGSCDPQADALCFAALAREHDFEFVRGEMLCMDRARQTITLSPQNGGDSACRVLAYDRLVLALGAVTSFYGVPGAQEHAATLDSVADAERFRQRLFAACHDAGEAPVQVVIAGGGATGVELAAELSNSTRALAPLKNIRISVMERDERVLPHMDLAQAQRAERHLRALGIAVHTSTSIAAVGADTITDACGRTHSAHIVLWAAGVEAPPLCATLGLSANHQRKILVDASLRSTSDSRVYALGDCASHVCPLQGEAPPRAQVAHQQAMFLAHLLAGEDTAGATFHYRDQGSLVSLGPLAAVGLLTRAATGL